MDWIDEDYESFDFETSGTLPEYALQPWRYAQGKAWATSFASIHRVNGTTYARGGLDPDRAMLERILLDAIADKRRMVGWNTVFDIGWLLAYGLEDLVMQLRWLDGMLIWKHATVEPEYDLSWQNKKSYGLKACVKELWPSQGDYSADIDFHDTSPAMRQKLHDYNIRDTFFTLKATKHWWGKLTDRQKRVALIEAAALPVVAKCNFEGIPVDTLLARELQGRLAGDAERCRGLLAPLGITEVVARSPTKLAAVLYEDWGLPVLKETVSAKTGKRSRSTDKSVLHELALGIDGAPPDPRIQCLRDYREALNNKTKFADAVLDSVEYNEDGCTHPLAMVFSTYSGRMTYASKQGRNKDERQIGFAIHQEKREKAFRKPLVAPQGYTIVEFDAAGQEFKWMAVASQDATMLDLCRPGQDAHCFMGARIKNWDYPQMMASHKLGDNPDVSGPQGIRMLGKVGNLSLQYRTSAPKFCQIARVDYKIPMTLPDAEHIHQTYRRTYPDVPVYWRSQIDLTKRTGYVATLAGRRVKVVGDWSGSMGWAMGSTAINYRIQGTGADQKYLAIACIRGLMPIYGVKLGWDLHDGLYFFVPDANVKKFASRGKQLLDNLPYKKAWDLDLPIQMTWDCKTGPSWGLLKDWVP